MYSATSGTAPAIPAIRALCTEAGVQIKPGNFGRFVIMEQQNILTRMPAGMFITAMYIPKRRCAL